MAMIGAPYVMGAVPVNDAPAIVPTVDNTRLTIEETMKYLRWTESDYVTARDGFGFPPCDAWRQTIADLLSQRIGKS